MYACICIYMCGYAYILYLYKHTFFMLCNYCVNLIIQIHTWILPKHYQLFPVCATSKTDWWDSWMETTEEYQTDKHKAWHYHHYLKTSFQQCWKPSPHHKLSDCHSTQWKLIIVNLEITSDSVISLYSIHPYHERHLCGVFSCCWSDVWFFNTVILWHS